MKKIEKGTIIRTGVLLFALANQLLTIAGKSPLPFENEEVAQGLSMLLTAGASLWAWWKNNSFTAAAIAADQRMKAEKAGQEIGI